MMAFTLSGKSLLIAALAMFLLSATVHAYADDSVIHDSCRNDLQMNNSECDCVVRAVNDTLSENQLNFFMASIQQDQQSMLALQAKLSQNEMLELAEFMTTTPTSCKGK